LCSGLKDDVITGVSVDRASPNIEEGTAKEHMKPQPTRSPKYKR